MLAIVGDMSPAQSLDALHLVRIEHNEPMELFPETVAGIPRLGGTLKENAGKVHQGL